MKQKLKRLFSAYGFLLGTLYQTAPVMVIMTFVAAVLLGVIQTPLTLYVNSHIFNDGLLVAQGKMAFGQYSFLLVLFALTALLPPVVNDIFIGGYVQFRSLLILRSAFREKMLQKIKRMKYAHFEDEKSIEIIDKAYNRAENSARHMFPMYVTWTLSSMVGAAGVIVYLARVRWWLVLTVVIPWVLEIIQRVRDNYSVYDELESYWKQEHSYGILADFLRRREYLKDNKVFRLSEHLTETYRKRLNARNRQYEGFYFKHLKRVLLKQNITKIGVLFNILLLLYLFLQGQLDVGMFIALTLYIYQNVYNTLNGCAVFFAASGYHINFFEYYEKYLSLSEDDAGECTDEVPEKLSIEFKDVWFRYPNTERDILKGLTFRIEPGERISLVGENGEGKSTMIKLLLGLFVPDKGEILLNGKPLLSYSSEARSQMFGVVFQDFVKYDISFRENVQVGDISNHSEEAFREAVEKSGLTEVLAKLPNGADTLLGREFENGVDLSGGQWQRIAMARAFLGDKPALILDEPTSQLDPIAESDLYTEFAEMSAGRTTIFITHRLASTMITDRILVISEGRIAENGPHDQLVKTGGIYARMYEAQKQWYVKEEGQVTAV
ncbi:MAG: ABC transporter ATP-binding protein [Oscillospiraceae bacterium]|jgi:ATP-binding cassette subfamily B protein|nr:ABC transporter ATP-binding protein [Oscillospiraceae bacterium]